MDKLHWKAFKLIVPLKHYPEYFCFLPTTNEKDNAGGVVDNLWLECHPISAELFDPRGNDVTPLLEDESKAS